MTNPHSDGPHSDAAYSNAPPGATPRTGRLTTVGLDADDTLWQNECFFRETEARFIELMRGHAEAETLPDLLLATERRNIAVYGFGVKSFTLSMIETALEASSGAVPAETIGQIMAAGRAMLAHPVELLPHARDALEALAGRYRLVLVTKGDLIDQERKLAASGLAAMFDAVEIVSDKRPETYAHVFARHAEGAGRAMMVGNSLKSDVLPMLAAGGYAAHVPHEMTWLLEHAPEPVGNPRFARLSDLGELAALLREIEG